MNFKKKSVMLVIFILVLSASLLGCSQSQTTSPSEPDATEKNTGTETESDKKVDFPKKDMTFIVPVSPGGGYDTISRMFIEYWAEQLPGDVNITVKNVPGGQWNIGLTELYKADPDGYTVGILNLPGNVTSEIMGTANYKLEDYKYIGRISDVTYVGAASKQSGIKSLEDLKAKKEIKAGVVGLSSTAGLGTVIAAERLGLNLKPIPHEGSNEAIISAMRGDVDYVQYPFGTLKGSIVDSDDLTPIIVYSDERLEDLPDVPTAKELGLEDLLSTVAMHRVIAAPPGTPDEILQILRDSFDKAVADPELKEKMIADSGSFSPKNSDFVDKIVESSLTEFQKYKGLLEKYSK